MSNFKGILDKLTISPWKEWLGQQNPDLEILETLEREGQGWPSLRILQLRLKNIKCFAQLELGLTGPQGEFRACSAIVGDNATGKSTILQAVSLVEKSLRNG